MKVISAVFFSSKIKQNSFLPQLGVFRNSMICTRCMDGSRMKYVKIKSSPDGFHWVCRKTCRFTLNIRHESFFEGTRLSMRIIFLIMYKHINRCPILDIAYELDIHRNTVSEYADLAREVISEYIYSNNDLLGGLNEDGTSKIVEIDESYFFKRKYNRGRLTNDQWYIGSVESGTKKAFIIQVPNRNARLLGK